MATENPPVNGMYGTQYNQPAELAASTPTATTGQAQTASSSASSQKADPQEIGWYFVEQYYTTLSKTPEKIHLFYSKKSQLVTGMEAEKVLPCVGTKAISDKIKALDIQDCKVRVLNVDSQSSFQNIVVQVIGEMSNKSEPHHKFVQTFVLAEQPNGYFVLNDIFRYLSDDVDEIVDEPIQPEVPAEEPATPVDPSVPEPEIEEEVTTEEAAKEVDEKLEELEPEAPAKSPAEPAVEESQVEEPVPEQPAATPPTEAPVEPAPAEESHPVQSPPPPATQKDSAIAQNEAPPAKKTWASMLGGKVAAVPALPINPTVNTQQPKQVRAPPSTPAPAAASTANATKSQPSTEPAASSSPTSQSNGWQTAEKKTNRPQNKATAEGITLAYIKNVNEKVDARILKEVLESFGELKYFDVSRQRNCAFVEFADSAGYNAAVAANPHTVGTEQIYVEERRPRPNTFGTPSAPFARGGGTPTGRGGRGGNMQQRTGSRDNYPKDAGRGTFQQRGAKSGTITPKGRGGQGAPTS